MAADLATQILDALDARDSFASADAFPDVPFAALKSALDRLHSRDMVLYQTIDREEAHLTDEGKLVAAEGSHEAKVFEAVRAAVEGLQIDRLPVCFGHQTPFSSLPLWDEQKGHAGACLSGLVPLP
jgi:phenylalanyl-tRNA synthetase alpha chain